MIIHDHEARPAAAPRPTCCLTIAGSDSGGGAGIQGDLKAFSAMGAYGATVITALTAQNTLGVTGIHAVPPEFVEAQLEAVLSDIPCDAVKTGMLATANITRGVATRLRAEGQRFPVVVDPVMVSTTGARLLDEDAVAALKGELLPLATICTPNALEAAALAGGEIRDIADAEEAARAIHAMGCHAVLVKGGDWNPESESVIDVLFDGSAVTTWVEPRIRTKHAHGSGCALASAIAVGLGRGQAMAEAVSNARRLVRRGLETAIGLGQGSGPVNHLAWERF